MPIPPILITIGAKLMFKKLRERAAKRAMTALKGKLTYASILALVLPIVSTWIGFEIIPADIEPFYAAVMAGVGLFGKWRASRGYA